MLISVENASFAYGGNLIFSDVTLAVNEGERIGLIGANGEGKTTLIKILLGELVPDSGSVSRKNGARIGYLEQNGGYESGNTVYGEMLSVFKEELAAVDKLSALSRQLASAQYGTREYSSLSAQIDRINSYIASRDCYNVEVNIKTVLNGMGFSGRYEQIISTMSGGEKTRLKLARLLLEKPDLLVLDEPTNHLDISTLFWLEEYLASFKGAILVVSHDRYFLDGICGRILEIENKKLLSFAGNYTKYKALKAELNARLAKEYEAQREERAKLQDYVDRNIVRATTAKSAKSRVKKLEKMEILQKPYVPPKPPAFGFSYDTKPYEEVLNIENLNLEIGGKRLICAGQLEIRRGEKVALVGENGTGKTTLLKTVFNGGSRAVKTGRYVKLAMYDQEGENLNKDNTVLAELWERHTGLTQTEARGMLAAFGLYEEDMDKKVGSLSGGERAKLALCVLAAERGNVLLLDEPTNHLDLPARESLEAALKKFDGTIIFVSHDRYFLNALADKVAEIENGALNTFVGGYAAFNAQKKKIKEEAVRAAESKKYEEAAARQSGYRSKRERAEETKRREEIKKTEDGIKALEAEESEINTLLSTPGAYSDYKRAQSLAARLEKIKEELDALYKRYGDMI